MTDLKLFNADSPEWGAMFMTRNNGGVKTSHDMAHGIGNKVRFDGDLTSYDKLPIVKLINDTFAEAGSSFRLTDRDASNFTLLPGNGNNFDGTNLGSKTNGVQSALIQKVATHGNHVATFDRVLTGGADGTQFLDELYVNLFEGLQEAAPDQKLRLVKQAAVDVLNYLSNVSASGTDLTT